jgi:Peptidase family M23
VIVRLFACLFGLFVAALPALGDSVALGGKFEQGGLVMGRAEPGAHVFLAGKPVKTGPDGVFVLGFGRDAGPSVQLTIVHAGGTTEQRMLAIAARSYDIQHIDGLDQNMVTPDPATDARIKAEQQMAKTARSEFSDLQAFLGPFVWPAKGPISGVYGSQRILNGEPKAPHFGTDIAAPEGSPVVAPADGIVRLAERDFYLTGGTVILDHGHGVFTSYLHLRAVSARPGQHLKQGEILGEVGMTGRATGPHLHWGLNWGEIRLDPAQLVPEMPLQ